MIVRHRTENRRPRGALGLLAFLLLAGCVGAPRSYSEKRPHHHGHAVRHRDEGSSGNGGAPGGRGAMWISPSLAAAIRRARIACDAGTPGACDHLRALLSEGFGHGPVPAGAPS